MQEFNVHKMWLYTLVVTPLIFMIPAIGYIALTARDITEFFSGIGTMLVLGFISIIIGIMTSFLILALLLWYWERLKNSEEFTFSIKKKKFLIFHLITSISTMLFLMILYREIDVVLLILPYSIVGFYFSYTMLSKSEEAIIKQKNIK